MSVFKIALKQTLQHEGGYANVSSDRGGETYCGISRKNWPAWRGWPIIDKAKPLKRDEILKDKHLADLVEVFYYEHFWKAIQGDRIQDQRIGSFLFDFYVNSGYHAIKAVQRIVKVKDDGLVGTQTLAAINAADSEAIFAGLKAARIKFLKDIAARKSDQRANLDGWLSRANSFV